MGMRALTIGLLLLVATGCDDGGSARPIDGGPIDAAARDGSAVDGASPEDGGSDASAFDARAADASSVDAGADASGGDAGDRGDSGRDGGGARTTLLPAYCPSTATAPGLYRGTLAGNLNDIAGASGCGALTAEGRDGAVRVELEPGQTVRARYRHAGDGVLYVLDSCPVTSTCLDGSDVSTDGEESIEWTNDGASSNPVYVVLDSTDPAGAQTFELDLEILGP
jgi:hypothetical protein